MGRKKVDLEVKISVKSLLQAGLSPSAISKQLNYSRNLVYNVKKKSSEGLELQNRSGQGRKRITSQAENRQLIRLSKQNRLETSRVLSQQWSVVIGKTVSASTVRRRLVEAGLLSYTQKKKPFRNHRKRKIRLNWCKKYNKWPVNQWYKVIFSDESHFELINRKNRRYVRRFSIEFNQPFCFAPKMQGGGGSLSVWGCFTAHGPGPLVFYEGRLNAHRYIDLLEGELPAYRDQIYGSDPESSFFQQDNAPCHKAKATMKWFEDSNIRTLDWPPTSPDMNPIENLWSIIDRRLLEYEINNLLQLKNAITEIWNSFSINDCIKLINSMPNRISGVLKAKGGSIASY